MEPHDLIDHFGNIATAAHSLRISSPSISQWVAAGRIPLPRQCQIEVLTGGALRAERDKDGLPVELHSRSTQDAA